MSQFLNQVNHPNLPTFTEEECNEMIHHFKDNFEKALVGYTDKNGAIVPGEPGEHVVGEISGIYMLFDKEYLSKVFATKNVAPEFLESISLQCIANLRRMPPHTDYSNRTINLVYLIEGQADTVFYKSDDYEKGVILHGDKFDTEEVERHTIEPHKWYFMNVSAIHGVENFRSNMRLMISSSLNCKFTDFEQICKELETKLFL